MPASVLFIAAAGNLGLNNEFYSFYPADYALDNVISVAASDHNDNRASFSNYGSTRVDLAAPGESILSTTPGGDYSYLDGTSMASPHVAGVAALAWSRKPDATYREIRDAIFDGVDPLVSLAGITVTGGRLNAHATLQNINLHEGSVTLDRAAYRAGDTAVITVFDADLDADSSSADSATVAVYDLVDHAVKMEALKYESTVTDENNCWAVLYGPDAVSAATLKLAIDEDQNDSERYHMDEQVAYLVFSAEASTDFDDVLIDHLAVDLGRV